MPIFFAALRPFLPLIGKVAAAIGIALLTWWAWSHFVKTPYIEQGVAQEHVNTVKEAKRADSAEAANLSLQADLTKLQVALAEVNKALSDLQDDQKAREAATNKLLASLKAREKALMAQIADLYATAHGAPAATPEEACREADRILSDLAAHRVLEPTLEAR